MLGVISGAISDAARHAPARFVRRVHGVLRKHSFSSFFVQSRAKSRSPLQWQLCRAANVAVPYAFLCKGGAKHEKQQQFCAQFLTRRVTRQLVLCSVSIDFFENNVFLYFLQRHFFLRFMTDLVEESCFLRAHR